MIWELGVVLALGAAGGGTGLPAASGDFRDDFTAPTLDLRWVITDHGRLGASDWVKDNVFLRDGFLILRHQLGKPMRGAELAWKEPVQYGTLTVRMKGGEAPGVLSTVFFYEEDEGKVHEIDIELFADQFSAPDLTDYMDWEEADDYEDGPHYFHVQPEIEGFDSRTWHTYSIRWEPKKVSWLIDGVVVAVSEKVVPFKAARIMFNSWHPTTWAKAEPDRDSEQIVDWVTWEGMKP